MHRSETGELTYCAECGNEIDPGLGRAYGFGPDAFLCYACAEQRGGVYDETRDRWVHDADTSDLDIGEG